MARPAFVAVAFFAAICGADRIGKAEGEVQYWSVQLDPDSSESLSRHWRASAGYTAANASGIAMKDEYHTTLLYIGHFSDQQIAAANDKLPSAAAAAKLRAALLAREGTQLKLEVSRFVWEDGFIAAAPIAFHIAEEEKLCANVYPHVTLGMAQGVAAVKSNELLSRRRAEGDFEAGLPEFLAQLKLKSMLPSLRAWCRDQGVSTLAALAARASEAAAAAGEDPEAAQEMAAKIRGATERPLHEESGSVLELTGTIGAHRYS
ncbi:unnamed protein product [Effrenium voratum]|uniref:tRNA ligase phosphodiesterase domain-containing protein n=1 Tax=Effrenium voratum TaxID=2562239 RepID=A0AA36JB33_9DINO|nr:unnamed protein product [Effrenium voratum]CAJ1413008.1 unnamed protein product [Effrenium voratum]